MSCVAALCIATSMITVTDGDTFRAGDLRVRLWGINAPELDEPGGQAAKQVLALYVMNHPTLVCERKGKSWNRVVARCDVVGGALDGIDLACALVAAGAAQDAPRYSKGHYRGCR